MKRFPWRTVVPVTQRLAVIVFLPILGMVSARAWAGDNVWTSIGPAGTWVSDLVVDPQSPNRVYLGAAVEGVHRVFMSTDGGATWTDSGFAMPSPSLWFGGLAVRAQGAPGTVYAGTPGQGVFAITFPPGRREILLQIRYRLATRPLLGKP